MARSVFFTLLSLLVAALALLGAPGVAHAEEAAMAVDLYTIGPSGELPSRFGHSILCARPAGDEAPAAGRCYDYGVSERPELVHNIWTSVRGQPTFAPIAVEEPRVVGFYRDQGRQIERQRLPLSREEAASLVAAIEEEVRERRTYAYHPYFANCSTKIRDRIDAATGGRLRAGPSEIPPGTFREYMEEGHSGRVGILTAMTLFLGEPSDRAPTPWEAMLLPFVLRDAVADRLGASPERLEERVAYVLPTSRAVGKLTVFALAFALFVSARLAARRRRVRLALMIVGGALGALALTAELVAVVATWPELSRSWALVLFLPTDLALPYLRGRRLTGYLKVRIGMALAFAALELVGVIDQPMLPLVALVALPMAGLLSALRERAPGPGAPAAPAATLSPR